LLVHVKHLTASQTINDFTTNSVLAHLRQMEAAQTVPVFIQAATLHRPHIGRGVQTDGDIHEPGRNRRVR
jgi:hypothetical protein